MAKSNNQKAFVSRVSAASATGRSGRDAWIQYMQSDTGTSGTPRDLEMRWLRKHGGVGNTYADLWHSYLNGKGIPAGNLGNRQEQFFRTASAA